MGWEGWSYRYVILNTFKQPVDCRGPAQRAGRDDPGIWTRVKQPPERRAADHIKVTEAETGAERYVTDELPQPA